MKIFSSFIPLFVLLNLAFLSPALAQPLQPPSDWQDFERRVRDGKISYHDGEKAISEWAHALEMRFPLSQFRKDISFPLRGYSTKDVGGKNGDGYKPEGYRFLDGNRHQGHPAQDIFVRDRDQDGLDDLTGRPIDVLTLAEGIVLSTFSDWKKTGPLPRDKRRQLCVDLSSGPGSSFLLRSSRKGFCGPGGQGSRRRGHCYAGPIREKRLPFSLSHASSSHDSLLQNHGTHEPLPSLKVNCCWHRS